MAISPHDATPIDDIPLPSARSTGFVFAAVAVIVALLWRDMSAVWAPALALAAVFAVMAQFASGALAPLNRAWFRFALLLNAIMSPIVMLILYLIVIVPMGLAMQRVRDPLAKRRRVDDADTYWIDVRAEHAARDMRDQF